MNTRIQTLVRQAGLNDADLLIEDWHNAPLAKFAELIIAECDRLNLAQSYNLLGVLVDLDEPDAEFDAVCLSTVKHVHAYLARNSLTNHFEKD